MKHYIEITLLPSAEIPIYFLWEKVYQQVHLALVERQDDGMVAIGVSFPEYDAKRCQLGNKLRMFAINQQELTQLNITTWFSRLMDYVHVSSIKNVPDKCQFAIFKRLQPKTSNARHTRMAKRKAKRENISFDQAFATIGDRKKPGNEVPFIHSKSLSSDKRYRLMIGSLKTKQSYNEEFNTYGLSSVSTVPVF